MEMVKMILNYSLFLFVIIDPFVSLAIMLSLLPESKDRNIPRIAFRSSLAVLLGGILIILAGNSILQFFGVDVSSFKIMGGIILLLLSIQMVQAQISGTRYAAKEAEEARHKSDISITPLAIPITLGPGTITTLLIYRNHITVNQIWALIAAVGVNCVILYLILRNAMTLQRVLSKTILNIFTRIMGLIVGSIALQFIITGAKELWVK